MSADRNRSLTWQGLDGWDLDDDVSQPPMFSTPLSPGDCEVQFEAGPVTTVGLCRSSS